MIGLVGVERVHYLASLGSTEGFLGTFAYHTGIWHGSFSGNVGLLCTRTRFRIFEQKSFRPARRYLKNSVCSPLD